MHIKSPYPHPPQLPAQNAHNFMLNRPEQASWADYTLHIDALSGRKRTYREFRERVALGATALGAPVAAGGLGISGEAGEIVGILSDNSMDYIVLVHALLYITTPFAPLSSYSTAYELGHAIRLSKVTRLFVHPRHIQLAISVAKAAGIPEDKVYVLGGRFQGRKSLDDLIKDAQTKKLAPLAVRPAREDTLAYLVFSSGTTGLPKAVMVSHGNLVYAVYQASIPMMETASVYTPPPPDTPEGLQVNLAFLPFHHTLGLHAYLFRAFLSRNTIVILPKWNIEDALMAIPKYRVTGLILVPGIAMQLLDHPNINNVDLSSLQSIMSGASYLPPKLSNKLSKLGKEPLLSEGYGLSECTFSAIGHPHPGTLNGLGKRVPGSLGLLQAGMEARILREDGSDASVNEPGDLWLKGENVVSGYWHNEKATRETFFGEWMKTGDRFRVNEEGYFFYLDRAKDILKVSGSQVSPVEIENVLLSQPDMLITDATVAGVSGGRTSDEKIPRAWVVLSNAGKERGAAEVAFVLDSLVKQTLSKQKWLRGGVEFVDEIPKSPTGKTLRRTLQEKYEARNSMVRAKL